MDTQIFDYQATTIERILSTFNIPTRIDRGVIGPRVVHFPLLVGPGTAIGTIASRAPEIAHALEVDDVRVFRRRGDIIVEVPRGRFSTTTLRELLSGIQREKLTPVCGALGLDLDGRAVIVRVTSPEIVHILVSGMTGSGKTVLMTSFLTSLAYLNPEGTVPLTLIDPKRRGFAPLESLPIVDGPVSSTMPDITKTISRLLDEMVRRDHEGISSPVMVVAIDELSDVLLESEKLRLGVLRLAQRGREAGIHLIAGTQRPSSDAIDTNVRSQFPTRVVGKVSSPQDARMAAGISGTGAENLLGRGDFVLVAGTSITRFQSAKAANGRSRDVGRGTPGRVALGSM